MNQGESINEAAGRVLDEFTGIDGIFMEQLGAYGEVERDLGERVVSIAYYALVDMDKFDTSLVEKYDARWISISHLPELIFDHNKMVRDTINTLQRRASSEAYRF